MIVPIGLEPPVCGGAKERVATNHFDSIPAYSRLLLSREFYEQFQDFEYILIYQFDCLALSSDLSTWCNQGWSYIGAPFFASKSDPSLGFSRVGNGGLSLRNVAATLRVLTSDKIPNLDAMWNDMMPDVPVGEYKKTIAGASCCKTGVDWYAGHYTLNEDLFWSDRADYLILHFPLRPSRMDCNSPLRLIHATVLSRTITGFPLVHTPGQSGIVRSGNLIF